MKSQLTLAVILLALTSHMVHFSQSTCFTSISDTILQGHVIFSYSTADLNDCWQTCKNDGRCQSLNFFLKKHLCEINNRTIEHVPKDALVVPDTTYFDNPYRVAVGTVEEMPAVSCAEILKSVGDISGRYWFVDHAQLSSLKYCNMTTLAIENCAAGQCKNGGECIYFGLGKYLCACPQYTSGQNCEIKMGICDTSNPCKNGGTCIDLGVSYACKCMFNRYGNNCEKTCNGQPALGMSSMVIRDSQITASTTYPGAAPPFARLNLNYGGKPGGWVAGTQTVGSWIQVSLDRANFITAVATQGRSDKYQWVTSYILAYKTTPGASFISYEGGKVFSGNVNRDNVVKNNLSPALYGRYIRLIVKTWHGWISLRMELYGCNQS